MARRRRGPSISQRATARVSRSPVPRRMVQVYPRVKVVNLDKRLFEDRRTWHPLAKMRSAGVIGHRDARRIVAHYNKPHNWRDHLRRFLDPLLDHPSRYDAPPGFLPASRQAFKFPDRVLVCVRRKQRRETLFALGRTGKGSKNPNRRRSEYSDVSCRRT